MKKGVVGGVSASMPLFTGGQIVNGNKLAKVNIQVNRLQYNQSENEVKLTTGELLLAGCDVEREVADHYRGRGTVG